MRKRGEIAPNFSSFLHYFIYIYLTSGVKFHIHLLNVVVQIVFLTLSTLICRGTKISKCFSDPLEFEIMRVDCILLARNLTFKYYATSHSNLRVYFVSIGVYSA